MIFYFRICRLVSKFSFDNRVIWIVLIFFKVLKMIVLIEVVLNDRKFFTFVFVCIGIRLEFIWCKFGVSFILIKVGIEIL